MYDDVKTLFFLDFGSYPIALRMDVQYRVIETRAVMPHTRLLRVVEIWHLVEEVTSDGATAT